MGIPYPKSGGLGNLYEALAGGISFGGKLLAAVGVALDGAAMEGLGLLAAGRARVTAVEESFGVLAGGWTGQAGVVRGSVAGPMKLLVA